jgi:hypothetical protein
MDRDERDDEEVSKLAGRLRGDAKLCLLRKREIENYLLIPRVLSGYLSSRLGDGGTGRANDRLAEDSIRAELDTIADELKELAVCKHLIRRLCFPNYSDLDAREALAKGGVAAVEGDFSGRMQRMTLAAGQVQGIAEQVRGSWKILGVRKSWI